MTSVRMSFGWASAAEVIQGFCALMADAPEHLDLFLMMRTTGPDRFVDTASAGPPGAVPGTPFIEVEGHMLAGTEETRTTLAPLLELAGPDAAAIEELAYAEAASRERPLAIFEDPAPATLRPQRTASDYCVGSLGEREAGAIVGFVEALQHDPELTGGGVIVEAANGAVGRLAPTDTAYPHRAADFLFEWEIFHGPRVPPALDERHDDLLGELRSRLAGVLTGGRYVNYADRLDHPGDWWGPNLERLEAIVAHVDPAGLVHSRLRPGPTG